MKTIFTRRGEPILVDDWNHAWLNSFDWYLKDGYALVRNGPECRKKMHRMILGLGARLPHVDHVNGDRADNQEHNLRTATFSQNAHNRVKYANNTSGYKGVTWYRKYEKWVAQITIDKKHKTLGYFDTPEEAHAAYCAAALQLHGEFARF